MQSVLAASRFQPAQILFLAPYRTASTSSAAVPSQSLATGKHHHYLEFLPLHESTSRLSIGSVVTHEPAHFCTASSLSTTLFCPPTTRILRSTLGFSIPFLHLPPSILEITRGNLRLTGLPGFAICRRCPSIPGAVAPEILVTDQDIGRRPGKQASLCGRRIPSQVLI